MTSALRPRRRRWPYYLLAALLLLGLVGAAGWHYRVKVAEQAARVAMGAAGMADDLSFRVVAVEPDRLVLADLQYGAGGPTAERAEIAFRPGALARGVIETVRLVRPSLTLQQGPDGAVAVAGLPTGGPASGDGDAAGAPAFPDLPAIARLEIADAAIHIDLPGLTGEGSSDVALVLGEDGAWRGDLSGAMETAGGESLTLVGEGLRIAYGPSRVDLTGPLRLWASSKPAKVDGDGHIWLDGRFRPDGAVDLETLVMAARAVAIDRARMADLRGRVIVRQPAGGPPAVRADLMASGVTAGPARLDVIGLVGDLDNGAIALQADAAGPVDAVTLTVDTPQDQRTIAIAASGEIGAADLAALVPDLAADGVIEFEGDLTARLDALLADPDPSHLTGALSVKTAVPRLGFRDLIVEGQARGSFDLAVSGGAVTLTSPGFLVGGVNLPAEVLASLPADIRRAFADAAFLRMGGPGLAETVLTFSARPDGGVAAVGKLGLAVSNPNLALFFEGDGAVATDAAGGLAVLESEAAALRLVDAQLGPARISGRIGLAGLTGFGERISAEATLALSAAATVGEYSVRRAEIDLAGPVEITRLSARLTPTVGGRIRLVGVSGPLLSARDPISLTLRGGDRRIVYDRVKDTLAARLDFRGFRARGRLNPGGGESPLNLALGGLGLTFDRTGLNLRFRDVAAELPAQQVAFSGGAATIAIGASQARKGRLRVGSIRHLASPPLFRPMSLNLDVTGRGERLDFSGALIAAADKARLTVGGSHNLANGRGRARFGVGPVVFAPGVVQPQDFVSPLYRTLLETIGQVAANAEVAWSTAGLGAQSGRLNLTIDKLRTAEVTLERMATEFQLSSLLPPRSAGAQRIRIGRLDVGVPLTLGVVDVNLVSPERIEAAIERFELFGGLIESQRLVIDPTQESFDAELKVRDIDLASILAFAEFGELQATGTLEGRIPISYRKGEIRVHDGLLKTAAGGGRLVYKPKAIDEALKEADRSTSLAIQALANFVYDEISIRINEIEAEELRLDIHIRGKSLDVFDGLPFEFNIKVEGPIRQIIQENLAPPELPPDIQDMIDRGARVDPTR